MISIELVTYDPDNSDTYPSVCADPDEVKHRFGFEGGETLVFTQHGQYLGELTKQLDEMIGESALQAAWAMLSGNGRAVRSHEQRITELHDLRSTLERAS